MIGRHVVGAFNGVPIVRNDLVTTVPKMTVTREFERIQDPALVASTNAWMRKFFGSTQQALKMTDPASGRTFLVMHGDAIESLKKEAIYKSTPAEMERFNREYREGW